MKISGQTTIIAMVLIVMLFMGLLIIISMAGDSGESDEYGKFYANNMLISLLRVDSGYSEYPQYCKTMTEVMFCAEFTPSFRCGETECKDLADEMIETYAPKVLKPNMGFYIEYGRSSAGWPDIKNSKQKWVAAQEIMRGSSVLDVRLTLAGVSHLK
jgi:hypothetical protein